MASRNYETRPVRNETLERNKAIVRMHDQGYTVEQIAKLVGSSPSVVRRRVLMAEGIDVHNQHHRGKKRNTIGKLVPLTSDKLPLHTRAGTVWIVPIKPPRIGTLRDSPCEHCYLSELCREAVLDGDFIGCETPLIWELKEV